MRDIILNQHQQILHSLEVNKNVRVEGSFDEIIVSGMGGSALPGELLSALELATIPLRVHRDYGLPHITGKKPLIIVSTYSGNTEESLSAYQAARQAGYALLANTAGGKIEEWSTRDGVPVAKIDFPGMQPRHTLLASFTGLAMALSNSGLTRALNDELTTATETLKSAIASIEAPAKQLAKKLAGAIPVYIAAHPLSFAARNLKIQTNENAKAPAFWNELPEMNHNEMVGFTELAAHFKQSPPPFHAVFLRSSDDHPRTSARMDITADLYAEWGVPVSTFEIKGATVMDKLFYAAVAGLWTTYFLAEAAHIDPVPVAGVENFKKKLEQTAGSV